MNVPFLDLKRQVGPLWTSAAHRVVESGWYIHGPEVAAFETHFAEYCGTTHCAGTANGTDSLELALRALGISTGDEVASVANAGMYSLTAIRATGAKPVLVDIDDRTMLMSPAGLRAALSPETKAIIVTHLYGRLADMESILNIAGGIPVIEDCAQAHGAIRHGRRAGNWGTAGCFSFYPTKNLGAAGDAGAVVTSDATFDSRLRALRQYGWIKRFCSSTPGGRNSRLDEIQAAILTAKLPLLDAWNQRRRDIAKRYNDALNGYPPYKLPEIFGDDYVAHLYVIRCPRRDLLKARLAERGIQTEIHYPTLDHNQLSQTNLPFRIESLAVSEKAVAEVLSLPCYPELKEEELEFVIRSLQELSDEL